MIDKLTMIVNMPHVVKFKMGFDRSSKPTESPLTGQPIDQSEDGKYDLYWYAIVDVTEEKKGIPGIGACEFGNAVDMSVPLEQLIDEAYERLKDSAAEVREMFGVVT